MKGGEVIERHRKPVRLAQAALSAAVAGKWELAVRYAQRISDECGGDGITTALIAWCDTYLDHATDGDMTPVQAGLAFVDSDTGRLDRAGSAQVPAPVQWAGRLVAARGAMDEATWDEVIGELPPDPAEVGRYILAVLRCVAATFNGLPRGFAVMGRAR